MITNINFLKAIIVMFFTSVYMNQVYANESFKVHDKEKIETLDLDVISYDDFVECNSQTLSILIKALYEKGIVGIKGVPGYKEKVHTFIKRSREFTSLSSQIKNSYAPNRSLGELTGYEQGKERFKRPDGKWVIDDLKVSYYAYIPENPLNKWPSEVDLQTAFLDLGMLMSQMGESVMEKIGLVGSNTGIYLNETPSFGRMLYYRKNEESAKENPYWCGAHFDHGLFTALLPAFYFFNGELIPEPIEAGLFVKTTLEGEFKKVVSNDPDVLLFQVGEFAQLLTNDVIRATEHRVHKAEGSVERYTMALFFDVPMDTIIHSFSELTQDERYGGEIGAPCSYNQWSEASFNRYLVKDEEEGSASKN